MIESTLRVALSERSYPIICGHQCLNELGGLCHSVGLQGRAALITNSTVGSHYADRLSSALSSAGINTHTLEVPDGEEYKNSESLNLIYEFLISGGYDRSSFLVALGGGVVGDMVGFAAATFLRGVPFVQVPTTLLAQVDSSVGGKTGINHRLGKNLIGAFYQPRLVLIDSSTLQTLPQREYLGGMAEVVKYGAVLDGDLFSRLEQNVAGLLKREPALLMDVVRCCCSLKASVVEQDERESGLRAVLNYGHTIGHAVETLTGYQKVTHGEAVSIGMVQASLISERYGMAEGDHTARIRNLLVSLGLPVLLPAFSPDEYVAVLMRDKKIKQGGLNFVLNRGIGSHAFQQVTDLHELLAHCTQRS